MSPPRLPQRLLSRDHRQQPGGASMAGCAAALLPLVLQLISLTPAREMGRGKSGHRGLRGGRAGPCPGSDQSERMRWGRGCLSRPCRGVSPPASVLPSMEESAWWGSSEAEAWGPEEGGGFLLWPPQEFLQAAVGERLPWNPGV